MSVAICRSHIASNRPRRQDWDTESNDAFDSDEEFLSCYSDVPPTPERR